MSDTTPSGPVSACDVVGCTDHGTHARWVVLEDGGKRRISVCWKHAEGAIDPKDIEAAAS